MDHPTFEILMLSIVVSTLLFIAAGVSADFGHRRWAVAFAVLATLLAAPILLRLLAHAWTI